jgi:hypothetical protein
MRQGQVAEMERTKKCDLLHCIGESAGGQTVVDPFANRGKGFAELFRAKTA